MKVVFISDIHSNLEALKAVLKEIDELKIEKFFCLGDVVGYGSDCNMCCEIIRQRKIPSILGNHEVAVIKSNALGFNPIASEAIFWTIDHITEENLEFLKTFPEKIEVTLDGLKILIVHGSPFDPINEYVFPNYPLERIVDAVDAKIIIMGHTHIPFVKEVKGCLIVNSGAVGQPRDRNPNACYAILDTEKRNVEIFRVKYDVKTTAEKIIKSGLPQFLAQRLFLGV